MASSISHSRLFKLTIILQALLFLSSATSLFQVSTLEVAIAKNSATLSFDGKNYLVEFTSVLHKQIDKSDRLMQSEAVIEFLYGIFGIGIF